MTKGARQKEKAPVINRGRHEYNCSVCCHQQREEIERDFVNWVSPATTAKHYKLANRASIYRHAHAVDLFPKRQRNVRAALEKIIERAGEVDVTAPAVVAAVQAYSKINSSGQWIDRSEHVDLNALFEKMTAQELEAYAQNGALPAWFTGTVGATARDGRQDPGVRRGATQATESGGSVLGTKEPDWIAALAPAQNQVRA